MMTTAIALITPSEVKEHLDNDAQYSIIDARPYSHYLAGHIPGAVWMGWEAWCEQAPACTEQPLLQEAGYWGVLKEHTIRSLRQSLQQLGLRDGCPAIVYADGPNSKGREGRIAWMLLYWGISSVLLLNGGWSAWLKNGGRSDEGTPTATCGQFQIRVQAHRRVQFSQLRQDYQGNTLPLMVDVRSREEFVGRYYHYQPRMGRLPGAVHMPFSNLFDEAGNFVTKSVYLQHLPPEISNADRCVAYCEVGVRSCLFALLHEVYTGQVIANFDGSAMEWALHSELPMEYDVAPEQREP